MNVEVFKISLPDVNKEILPATSELEKIKDEKSRKHLQKLAYTNIVNRFDATIDGILIDNCRSPYLVEKATANLSSTVTESDLIKLLLKGKDIEEALTTKLSDALRSNVLRERHSKKLHHLFELVGQGKEALNKPRVNINTGKILDKMNSGGTTKSLTPYVGLLTGIFQAECFGSWAGKMKFMDNDLKQLKQIFNCVPATTFRIRKIYDPVNRNFL